MGMTYQEVADVISIALNTDKDKLYRRATGTMDIILSNIIKGYDSNSVKVYCAYSGPTHIITYVSGAEDFIGHTLYSNGLCKIFIGLDRFRKDRHTIEISLSSLRFEVKSILETISPIANKKYIPEIIAAKVKQEFLLIDSPRDMIFAIGIEMNGDGDDPINNELLKVVGEAFLDADITTLLDYGAYIDLCKAIEHDGRTRNE